MSYLAWKFLVKGSLVSWETGGGIGIVDEGSLIGSGAGFSGIISITGFGIKFTGGLSIIGSFLFR